MRRSAVETPIYRAATETVMDGEDNFDSVMFWEKSGSRFTSTAFEGLSSLETYPTDVLQATL